MATLNGIVRFSGQLGDLVFYRRGKKDVVRYAPTVHHLSENSRKSATDFGNASRNAAYIRKAFAALVKDYGYGDLHNRLNKKLIEIFKTAPPTQAGQKNLVDGNIKLLQEFQFNAATRLEQLLIQKPKVMLTEGSIQLLLPKIQTKNLVKFVPKSDDFVLQLSIFSFEVCSEKYEIVKVNDLRFSLEQSHFPGAKLQIPVEQEGNRILLVAIGLHYLHEESRKDDRRYYGCQISHCFHIQDGVEVAFVAPLIERVELLDEEEQGLSWEMGG
ncbi:hypothetical protein ASE92_06500 [Pedobacter sp. Leaf41]|uniref:hypothetical protein n=1 Tax=Pedobacter sp. Leaf41 TaxID=1736218 RepID=UPI0007023E12|nr:hypothetical protein [Pedobacter sp. Leaf41]KQN35791.1 hypothetical protein ASE92_06500 [Pedobacter sp. Leaf41]